MKKLNLATDLHRKTQMKINSFKYTNTRDSFLIIIEKNISENLCESVANFSQWKSVAE